MTKANVKRKKTSNPPFLIVGWDDTTIAMWHDFKPMN
jgi:hypothetical protein